MVSKINLIVTLEHLIIFLVPVFNILLSKVPEILISDSHDPEHVSFTIAPTLLLQP
jgi:hypothetical protein